MLEIDQVWYGELKMHGCMGLLACHSRGFRFFRLLQLIRAHCQGIPRASRPHVSHQIRQNGVDGTCTPENHRKTSGISPENFGCLMYSHGLENSLWQKYILGH